VLGKSFRNRIEPPMALIRVLEIWGQKNIQQEKSKKHLTEKKFSVIINLSNEREVTDMTITITTVLNDIDTDRIIETYYHWHNQYKTYTVRNAVNQYLGNYYKNFMGKLLLDIKERDQIEEEVKRILDIKEEE
jgi:hypothetical protein